MIEPGDNCLRCCYRKATRECVARPALWMRVCDLCFEEMGNERYLYEPPDGRLIDPARWGERWCADPSPADCVAIDARPAEQQALERGFASRHALVVSPAIWDRIMRSVGRHPRGSPARCLRSDQLGLLGPFDVLLFFEDLDRGSR